MARPKFLPDAAQADTLREMAIQARKIERAVDELNRLVAQAERQGIPRLTISQTSRLARATVDRRLQRQAPEPYSQP